MNKQIKEDLKMLINRFGQNLIKIEQGQTLSNGGSIPNFEEVKKLHESLDRIFVFVDRVFDEKGKKEEEEISKKVLERLKDFEGYENIPQCGCDFSNPNKESKSPGIKIKELGQRSYELYVLFNSGVEKSIKCESEEEMNDIFDKIAQYEDLEDLDIVDDYIVIRVSDISYMEKIIE